jgi:hypothetical protein
MWRNGQRGGAEHSAVRRSVGRRWWRARRLSKVTACRTTSQRLQRYLCQMGQGRRASPSGATSFGPSTFGKRDCRRSHVPSSASPALSWISLHPAHGRRRHGRRRPRCPVVRQVVPAMGTSHLPMLAVDIDTQLHGRRRRRYLQHHHPSLGRPPLSAVTAAAWSSSAQCNWPASRTHHLHLTSRHRAPSPSCRSRCENALSAHQTPLSPTPVPEVTRLTR